MLEVGTGSGYSTMVLSLLGSHVVSVERHEALSAGAARLLRALAIENVQLVVGDGSLGVPGRAPFDAIAVHATAPAPPPALLGQLAEGGRLVIPIASGEADVLTLLQREGEGFRTEVIGPCRFVPLIGEEGFDEG